MYMGILCIRKNIYSHHLKDILNEIIYIYIYVLFTNKWKTKKK